MTHLSPGEFVELLDGALEAARAAHVAGCRTCAAQVDDLRRALADAAVPPPHEPSPLFWEHFSARVSSAVRNEPIRPHAGWRLWFRRRPAFSLSVNAALIALLALLALAALLGRPPAEVPGPAAEMAAAPSATDWNAGDDFENEDAWALLSAAVEDIQWDEAQEAGLAPAPGAAAKALAELTPEERAELASLLEEEMRRAGV